MSLPYELPQENDLMLRFMNLMHSCMGKDVKYPSSQFQESYIDEDTGEILGISLWIRYYKKDVIDDMKQMGEEDINSAINEIEHRCTNIDDLTCFSHLLSEIGFLQKAIDTMQKAIDHSNGYSDYCLILETIQITRIVSVCQFEELFKKTMELAVDNSDYSYLLTISKYASKKDISFCLKKASSEYKDSMVCMHLATYYSSFDQIKAWEWYVLWFKSETYDCYHEILTVMEENNIDQQKIIFMADKMIKVEMDENAREWIYLTLEEVLSDESHLKKYKQWYLNNTIL